MKAWERRGDSLYYRSGNWEYQILRRPGHQYRLYKKHIRDESWDILNDFDDVEAAKAAA